MARAAVVAQVCQNVSLPLFTDSLSGTVPYFVFLWSSLCFVVIFGVCLVLTALCTKPVLLSPDITDLLRHLEHGFACVIGVRHASGCGSGSAALRSSIFVVSYCLTVSGAAKLLRHAEGATWTVVVQSLETPMGALWWCLFHENPFVWQPHWHSSQTCTLAGLCLMVPGIIGYQLAASRTELLPAASDDALGNLAAAPDAGGIAARRGGKAAGAAAADEEEPLDPKASYNT
jgi:hypothetical protein